MALPVIALTGITAELVEDDDISPGDLLDGAETVFHGVETAYDAVTHVTHSVLHNPINFSVGLFLGIYFS